MPPILALVLCVALVLLILRIERKWNSEASFALWIPTIALCLNGAKPIGKWFATAEITSGGSDEAGSPLDRLVLSILIGLAVMILYRRRIAWSVVVRDNFWLILLFLYLGLSIVWSEFPFVSFKRWIRLCGAVPIAMIILTERRPLEALESIFRRCGYILIPLSILLIKYFPNSGVAYVSWSGEKMWVGVASQKNGLGLICALSAFTIIWSMHRKWRAGVLFKNGSQLFADGLVFAIAVYLINGFNDAYSATSYGMLILGSVVLLLLYQAKSYARSAAMLLVGGLAVVLLLLPFANTLTSTVTTAFQRDSSFTGRTDIWSAVLDVASRNPWVGVGYGGFWGLADEEIYSTLGVREAHSGYLDVYLEGGIIGLVLLFAFLVAHYLRTLRELAYSREWSLYGICLLMMSLVHNFTEANFIVTSSYFWNVMVFLTIAFSEPLLVPPPARETVYDNSNGVLQSTM